MRELNGTAAAVLGFLTTGERSGYDIAKGLQSLVGDFWNVTTSQIYRELRTLADEGLVVAGPVGARDRRPYSLTGAGRAALNRWLDEPPGSDTVRVPLLLKLFMLFHLADPDEGALANMADAYRTAHADQLARLEKELPELEGADCPSRTSSVMASSTSAPCLVGSTAFRGGAAREQGSRRLPRILSRGTGLKWFAIRLAPCCTDVDGHRGLGSS